ncbi:hypothetical protein ACLOJK_026825 [Asimina triloba]
MQQRLQTGSKHMTSGSDLHLHVRPAVTHPSPFGHDIKAAMELMLRSSRSKGHTPPAARSSHASDPIRPHPAARIAPPNRTSRRSTEPSAEPIRQPFITSDRGQMGVTHLDPPSSLAIRTQKVQQASRQNQGRTHSKQQSSNPSAIHPENQAPIPLIQQSN